MSDICIIGLDTAKHVFQVHAVGKEKTILRRRLPRDRVLPFFASFAPCTVGLEACGAAHHWAREIAKFGHDVRLMPPSYVRTLREITESRSVVVRRNDSGLGIPARGEPA